jgi:tetraacyldisaccharide 4'-kinase
VNGAVHPLRRLLWPLGWLYGAGMAARNAAFASGLRRPYRLPVPVVSVGNLTVGGSGKTPAVLWLAELAHAAGRRVGVLARGYGRAPGALRNDEGELLQQRLPWLLQDQAADRVAAGRRLIAAGADYLLLDDGFQHRRLHRDVEVVCVDAEQPFGNGLCLPAGDLRERPAGLSRADVVLLTRAGALAGEQLAVRSAQLRTVAGNQALPVLPCEHAPLDVIRQPGGEVMPVGALRGRKVALLSAIARPQSFRCTVEALGAEIVGATSWRDHHRFSAATAAAAVAAAIARGAQLLVTEKDAVKLAPLGAPFLTLRIGLRWLGPSPSPAMFLLPEART